MKSFRDRIARLAFDHPLLMSWVKPLQHMRQQAVRRKTAAAGQVLDRLAIQVRGEICVHLDEVGGDFWMDPRSDLFRRVIGQGRYEPAAIDIIQRHLKPDRDFLDIGANLGFFAVAGALGLENGRVLAVEPTASVFERLQRNLALNSVNHRVIAEQCLVGDREDSAEINVIPGREEYSSIGRLVHPSTTGVASVKERLPMHMLDTLVERHGLDPAVIKIDVEGAEGIVLAGAEKTLLRCRPVILAEFSLPLLEGFGTPASLILERLKALGYRLTDPGATDGRVGMRVFGELLAIPEGS